MSETTSHLFAVRTTGGQEKVVIRLLETRMRTIKKIREELKGFEDRQISPEEEEKAEELRKQLKSSESQFNVQSILLVDNIINVTASEISIILISIACVTINCVLVSSIALIIKE